MWKICALNEWIRIIAKGDSMGVLWRAEWVKFHTADKISYVHLVTKLDETDETDETHRIHMLSRLSSQIGRVLCCSRPIYVYPIYLIWIHSKLTYINSPFYDVRMYDIHTHFRPTHFESIYLCDWCWCWCYCYRRCCSISVFLVHKQIFHLVEYMYV